VFSLKGALLLGVIFLVVAVIYFVGWSGASFLVMDWAGAVMLGALGIAMAFGFAILLRNSREL